MSRPLKRPTQREVWLGKARSAGYHQDSRAFTFLRVEARVSYPTLLEHWRIGVSQYEAGLACGCYECAVARGSQLDREAREVGLA